MIIKDNKTPVVIINCKIAALGIMRSLGDFGIQTYGVDDDRWSPGLASRYCADRFLKNFDENDQKGFLEYMLMVGEKIGKPSILIPTSDETSVFVAEYADELSKFFIFPRNNPQLIKDLMSKKEMYNLALKYNVPTPRTLFPQNSDDVMKYMEKVTFPVMLKGIFGNRLQERTGKKMAIANSREELIENYKLLEDPENPNIMFQEYIPGGDDQIFIFNGYFNGNSDCLAAFTGYKVRQFPIHVGSASLGECRWNKKVSEITVNFMKAVGYKGILDIGYRFDARDSQYKVLDINPRIGQAFRLFLSENKMDVVRALYLDMTGQEMYSIAPREGRRWIIEDSDIISSYHYYIEGSLSLGQWLRSFKRLEEGAWFSLKDPFPFFLMIGRLFKRGFTWLGKRLNIIRDRQSKLLKAT